WDKNACQFGSLYAFTRTFRGMREYAPEISPAKRLVGSGSAPSQLLSPSRSSLSRSGGPRPPSTGRALGLLWHPACYQQGQSFDWVLLFERRKNSPTSFASRVQVVLDTTR